MTRALMLALGFALTSACAAAPAPEPPAPKRDLSISSGYGQPLTGFNGYPPFSQRRAAPPPTLPPEPSPTPGATRTFTVPLTGSEEVPPRSTPARGVTQLTLLAGDRAVHYTVRVSNLENVVKAHLHLGAAGENGPKVADLIAERPPGGGASAELLAAGVLTADQLEGPLGGKTIRDLWDAMQAGRIYVSLHTDDGKAPADAGPGDYPDGEIRGQVRLP